MELNTLRVSESVHEDIDALERTGSDWSYWDDLYYYVKGDSQNFSLDSLQPNLNESSYNTFDSFFLFNNSGKLIFNSRVVNHAARVNITDDELSGFLQKKAAILNADPLNDMISGFVIIPSYNGIALIHKIYPTDGNGQPSGTIILLRNIDDNFIEYLSNRTHLTVEGYTYEEISSLFPSDRVLNFSGQDEQTLIYQEDSDKIIGFLPIKDLNGNISYILKVTSSRPILKESLNTIYFFIFSLLLVILFSFLLIFFILTKKVINPLRNLDARIKEMSDTGSLKISISIEGEKEISELAESFNDVIKRIFLEENKINMSKRLYIELAEQMDSSVIILDSEKKIAYFNKAVNLYKEKPDEVIFCQDLKVGCLLKLPDIINQILSSGSVYENIYKEIINTRISGKKAVFEISIIPLADETETAYKTVLIIRDITEFIESQKKLKSEGFFQFSENLEIFQNLIQETNIPLSRIDSLSEFHEPPNNEKIQIQIRVIRDIIDEMKRTWIKSEKIHNFLLRYYKQGYYIKQWNEREKSETNIKGKKL